MLYQGLTCICLRQGGLTYPVHVWKDAEAKLLRTDTYGGVNSLIILQVLSFGAVRSVHCTAAGAGAWFCSQTLCCSTCRRRRFYCQLLTGSACAVQGTELEIYPRVDRHMCRVYDDDDEVSALEAPVRVPVSLHGTPSGSCACCSELCLLE